MSINIQNPIFSDDLVSATDLSRQTGRILDRALERPITISRNDHHFALLRREEIAYHVKKAAYSQLMVELLNVAFLLLNGKEIGCEHSYGWLNVFDLDELREFVREIVGAYRLVNSSESNWEQLDALIHEWHESAIAISSEALAEAWNDELKEVPLTLPFTVSCS
jgi:hypothetical protein